MNILQIAPYFPPYLGGQEKYVHLLSRELVRLGHCVTVLTSNYPPTRTVDELDGISIHRKKCLMRPLRNPISPGLFFPGFDVTEFDLIHAHNEHSLAALAAAQIKSRTHLPLVISCHGSLVFGSFIPDLIRSIYWKIVGRAVLQCANAITVATPSERRRLISLGRVDPGKIKVVPVGIDLAYWDGLVSPGQGCSLPIPSAQGKKLLLVATQLIRRKGIHNLLNALPFVRAAFPDILCVIAGTGDYEQKLMYLVKSLALEKEVVFLGRLDGKQLSQIYQQADVFILPSLGEGQPTCIMEAMAYARPVVATKIEGVVDYFGDIVYLAEPDNPASLAQKILEVLNDQEKARKFGQMGRRRVEEEFRWSIVAPRMITVYKTCLVLQRNIG